ncbi:MAG: hypothetical protein ABIP57_14490 [Jatrophihabitantaceae bacterium]
MSEGQTEPSSLRETTESLSQFGARVLNQLSITAWLPAAALVLCVAFILDLGGALDARVTVPAANGAGGRVARLHPGIADPLTAAMHTLSGVGLGGALLLIVAMTVLTMLTQAFAFEAIRVLEGYWGTGRLAESWAARRSATFREHRQDLDDLKVTLQMRAWHAARIRIEQTQAEDIRLNDDSEARTWTPDMLAVLGASLTGKRLTWTCRSSSGWSATRFRGRSTRRLTFDAR